MKRSLALVLLLTAGVGTFAQRPETSSTSSAVSVAQVSFHFERPGLPVPTFTFTVSEDGWGSYDANEVFPPEPGSDSPVTQHIARKVSLSRTATSQIFSTARALDLFNTRCASPAKNMADTGTKTLTYSGEGGSGSCAYNYSQDKQIVTLTDLFLAIAMTLDIGRKLDFDHRFDRLGLDATTASLMEQVESGRATEIGTIAATLKSIADDSEVLERVRLRAAKLLRVAQPSA